jgi:hypothetical protein
LSVNPCPYLFENADSNIRNFSEQATDFGAGGRFWGRRVDFRAGVSTLGQVVDFTELCLASLLSNPHRTLFQIAFTSTTTSAKLLPPRQILEWKQDRQGGVLLMLTGFDLAQHRLLRALRGAVAGQVLNAYPQVLGKWP